ncbi:hypothetical protein BDV27DRAFT_168913 [Aspergillus caelatus]|uniref:D-xylose reductase [NAD(P)H] n=1 Tax=Aspergillus caelatus TaxID=61420 RepID=A0A5N7ADH7_9EURO|nr:uncharacterized protein BDV27DRAFT_168913 [Aspergillus caelatus]KAE8367921.1 hypothetical protein BDV27DRAFT_168913 [Aspergillus caelatus]
MAGGTSIWASKEARTDPKEIFNLRLLYLLISVAWGGWFYGFDTGNIGGILTLPSFENAFGLNNLPTAEVDNRKGTIAAMLAAGGSAGALCAAPTSDFLGRKWSVFLWGFIFVVGAAMQMVADYDVLLAGRFIGGMGVGASSMLTPQFLAENSPKSVRGSMTATYNLMILAGIMLAFWINYGVSLWSFPGVEHDNTQWRTSMGIQLIPGALMCLMIPFVPETPRYLINHGRSEEGIKNLCRLRKLPIEHPYVQTEYQEIEAQVRYEQECHQGHSYWVVLQDIFLIKSNFQRFFLAVMLFLFHKFTGTDSLNYYAPEIFELIGVKGSSNSLLTTGVYGVVKFVVTIFYVTYLVDRVGRRLPLLVGACLQATAMLYLALYLRFAGTNTDTVGGTPAGGIVGIVWIYIYAFGWSFGHSVACYVVAAEIFPTRIRSVCMSICFFVNWIVDYGITRATPNMITEMGWGVFLLYALLTYAGVVFIFFCLPELKGRSIESIDDLFQRPLWSMWRHAYPTEDEKVRQGIPQLMKGLTHHTMATFTLNTGAKIPAVGFGTWKAAPGEAAAAVKTAFEVGYRHFDCAPLYGNEREIGEVFKSTKVPRSEYFVTTKLWSSDHRRVESALDKSLQDLGLNYVDLYLMHWPVTLDPSSNSAEYGKENRKVHAAGWDFSDTWREMEKLLETGKVRAIGVANFSTVNLDKLLKTAKVVPAVNQTEIQPLLPQDKLNAYCREKGIHQTAFGPLGGSGSTLHSHPDIVDIAAKRGCDTGNVMLSWGIQKGWSVIPKSTNPKRIQANLVGNVELTPDEMGRMDALALPKGKRFNRPDWGTVIFHDDADVDLEE